ncbi:hypothetical protein TNCV_4603551 [Trichonephila clavipes]|nr:hypothetical protein TNCV_4603551 [Trichonephila clavipes]
MASRNNGGMVDKVSRSADEPSGAGAFKKDQRERLEPMHEEKETGKNALHVLPGRDGESEWRLLEDLVILMICVGPTPYEEKSTRR